MTSNLSLPAAPWDMGWNIYQKWHVAAFKTPGKRYTQPSTDDWRAAKKVKPTPAAVPTAVPAAAVPAAATPAAAVPAAPVVLSDFAVCSQMVARSLKQVVSRVGWEQLLQRKVLMATGLQPESPIELESPPPPKRGRPAKQPRGAVAQQQRSAPAATPKLPAPPCRGDHQVEPPRVAEERRAADIIAEAESRREADDAVLQKAIVASEGRQNYSKGDALDRMQAALAEARSQMAASSKELPDHLHGLAQQYGVDRMALRARCEILLSVRCDM